MDSTQIANRINAVLAERGIDKKTFYDECEITSAAFSLWSTGKTDPRLKTLERIAAYLEVPVSYLTEPDVILPPEPHSGILKKRLQRYNVESPSPQAQRVARLYELADERDRQIIDLMLQKYEAQLPKVIPFVAPKKPAATLHRQARNDGFEDLDTFDQPSAAGLGNYLDVPVAQKEQYPLGIIPAGTSFGILISGDSMEPRIQNRATAFVQSAPAIDSGEIGIFVLNGQSYCKQLVIDRQKREVRLHSLNSKYEDITIHENDELRTIGRVLGSYPPVGMGAKPFEP